MGFLRFLGGAVIGVGLAPFTGGTSLLMTGLVSGALAEAIGSDEDERKLRKSFEQGIETGYHKGYIDTAKKFEAELERNDNFRFAAFALGNHIARLSGNQREKLDKIVYALGTPDSKILSAYVRSENKKIIDGNLTFNQIKEKYLSKL